MHLFVQVQSGVHVKAILTLFELRWLILRFPYPASSYDKHTYRTPNMSRTYQEHPQLSKDSISLRRNDKYSENSINYNKAFSHRFNNNLSPDWNKEVSNWISSDNYINTCANISLSSLIDFVLFFNLEADNFNFILYFKKSF